LQAELVGLRARPTVAAHNALQAALDARPTVAALRQLEARAAAAELRANQAQQANRPLMFGYAANIGQLPANQSRQIAPQYTPEQITVINNFKNLNR
ncbi:MAG: hypothetical protein ABSA84_07765, partial [Gammaproteobacteria bacterium]